MHALGPERIPGFSLNLYRWLMKNWHRFDGFIINGVWDSYGFAVWLVLRGRKPYMVFAHGMLDPLLQATVPSQAHEEMDILAAGGVLGAP